MKTIAIIALVGCLCSLSLAESEAATESAPPKKTLRVPFPIDLNFRPQDSWLPEIALGAFIVLFLINLWRGWKSNERRAIYWATQLISAESYLPDNFSLVGPGGAGEGEVLVRENMNTYHVHASGRRYCESMLLSFYMRKRQDLLAWGISVVTKVPDLLDIQVTMNPSAMPPLVLLIARADLSKAMAKDTADVKAFTKVVDVKKERLASWPTTDVVVHAEQVSTFYELMTPLLLEHTFGKGVWAEIGHCFRFLHITSEGQGTGAKQFINLSLTLPAERDAAHVLEWIRSVIILIDSLGTFKYTPEQTKRATENRSKKEILALNAAEEKRREELAARREKKAEEEQEKLRRMTPKQREKELERRQRIIQRRGLKTMMRKA